MRRPLAFVLSVLPLLALTGCGEEVFGTNDGGQALVALTCDPNPLEAGVSASGGGTWAVRYEAVLTEANGAAGKIIFVHGIVYDDATGAQVGSTFYDSDALKVFAGGDELVQKGAKRVLQQVTYSTSGDNNPGATLGIYVRILSENGRETSNALLVKVQ
jgi:hypothetical protein